MLGQTDIACGTALDPCNFFRKPENGVTCPSMAQCYQKKDDDAEENVASDQGDREVCSTDTAVDNRIPGALEVNRARNV